MIDFSEKEIDVLKKPINKISYFDHRDIISASNKILKGGTASDLAACAVRLAFSYDQSRVSYGEKAKYWEAAAIANQRCGKQCFELFKKAAELYAQDMNYAKAAANYEISAKVAELEGIDFEKIKISYILSRRQYEMLGHTIKSSELFVLEKNHSLKYAKFPKKILIYFFKVIALYGESPLRVFLASLVVVFSCSAIYFFLGITSSEEGKVIYSLFKSLYFSIVTFTTLGYGDFSPGSNIVRIISAIQAFSGMLLTSLFLVTIVRKYSR